MEQYRRRKKGQGLRAVQLWIPDIRSPAVALEMRPQSELASRSRDENAVLEFLDDVRAWDEAEARGGAGPAAL